MIITIDGPVATGKSTIAKLLAQTLAFDYCDTGAMYRCATWFLIKEQTDIKDSSAVQHAMDKFLLVIEKTASGKRYLVNGVDVTEVVRTLEITRAVSEIASLREVRARLGALQRGYAENANVIFEGRDMGTAVFPHADLKIFLSCEDKLRAQRRYDELSKQLQGKKDEISLEQVYREIKARDFVDSTRKLDPLRQPTDAHVVNTANKTPEEIVQEIIQLKCSSCGE